MEMTEKRKIKCGNKVKQEIMKNLKSTGWDKERDRIKGYRTSLLEPIRKGPQESSVKPQCLMGATELGRIFQLCRAESLIRSMQINEVRS